MQRLSKVMLDKCSEGWGDHRFDWQGWSSFFYLFLMTSPWAKTENTEQTPSHVIHSMDIHWKLQLH